MEKWIPSSSAGKISNAENDDEFSSEFSTHLDGLSDSLDGTRIYHCSPGSTDANNNMKLRDPLLCLGSVPALLSPQPVTCMSDLTDKSNIVYHTMSGQQPHATTTITTQNTTSNTSDWTNLLTSISFGQLYDTPFQYVLNAATTPCSKINDESLTYLNQGQSYELKLKKLGDASYTEQYFRSIVRVIFHERRLQYLEKEQLDMWKQARPGERILDIDIPLSYGLVDVQIDPEQLSCLHFVWDSNRESSGVYIKLNAISTEFTIKKHGGEKGVPLRIQVETYALPISYSQAHSSSHVAFSNLSDVSAKLIHCASCQVKVFKPKGADRKYKTDRDKIEKKSESEKEKFQPAFDYTVLSEIPLEQVRNYLDQQSGLNKPLVTSTSVEGSASSTSSTYFQPIAKTSAQSLSFQSSSHDIYFSQSQPVTDSTSYMSHVTTEAVLPMDDHVFADPLNLQSSINDFQRIQQLYHTPDPNSDSGYLNCFSYHQDVSRHSRSTSPAKSRSYEKLPDPSECTTISIISPTATQISPQGGEIKRVIYGPINMANQHSSRFHSLPSSHGFPHQFCENRSPISSPALLNSPNKKEIYPVKKISTSLPPSPNPITSDTRSPLQQSEENVNSANEDFPHSSRCLSESSFFSLTNQSACQDHVVPDMTSQQIVQWLVQNRFESCVQNFRDFTGADLLRLSREDLIQICGTVSGIRLNNALQLKPIRPKLTLYVEAVGKLATRIFNKCDERTSYHNTNDESATKQIQRSSGSGGGGSGGCGGSGGSGGSGGQPLKRMRKDHMKSQKMEISGRDKKSLKRSRSPSSSNQMKSSGSSSEENNSSPFNETENKNKKYRSKQIAPSASVRKDEDSEMHAVFLDVVNVKNLVVNLCAIFHLNSSHIRSLNLRRNVDNINIIVNDNVIQNLPDGLKLSVDAKDHENGQISLQLFSWS